MLDTTVSPAMLDSDKTTPEGNNSDYYGGAFVMRHTNGANFAFCDGHVKWMNPGQLLHVSPTSGAFSYFSSITD